MLAELLHGNWVWLLIIAVVAITQWSKYRDLEIKSRHNLRVREMEHQQRMSDLNVEIGRVKASSQRT